MGCMSDIERSCADIRGQIDELRRLIPRRSAASPAVSGWSVGMHVHHCGLAMCGIATALIECEEPPPTRRPGPRATLILKTGRIPRGAAQAPEVAMPTADVDARVLEQTLRRSELLLDRLPPVDERSWFRHFALGVLAKRDALRFVGVHNAHHLRIVADILS